MKGDTPEGIVSEPDLNCHLRDHCVEGVDMGRFMIWRARAVFSGPGYFKVAEGPLCRSGMHVYLAPVHLAMRGFVYSGE